MNISNQQNAFLLIPTYVADHPKVDDATAILFGRLNALSNQKGYCFASDKYLAEISKCTDREIRNRLKTLKELQFIVVHSEKNGLGWSRKIWTCNHYNSPSFQEFFTKGTDVPHRTEQVFRIDRHKCSEYKNKSELDNPPPKGSSNQKAKSPKPKVPPRMPQSKKATSLAKKIEEEKEFSRDEIGRALEIAGKQVAEMGRVKNLEKYVRKILQNERDTANLEKRYKEYKKKS